MSLFSYYASKQAIRWYAFALILVFIYALNYCAVSYKDVSSDPPYSSLVGLSFETLKPLKIHSVSNHGLIGSESGSKRGVDYYRVTAFPGVSGRYILEKKDLPVGSTFTVINVRRCKYCLAGELGRIDLVINLTSPFTFKLIDGISVRLDHFGQLFEFMESGDLGLNKDYFYEIKEESMTPTQ